MCVFCISCKEGKTLCPYVMKSKERMYQCILYSFDHVFFNTQAWKHWLNVTAGTCTEPHWNAEVPQENRSVCLRLGVSSSHQSKTVWAGTSDQSKPVRRTKASCLLLTLVMFTSLYEAVRAFHTRQHGSGITVNCCIQCTTVIVIFEDKHIKICVNKLIKVSQNAPVRSLSRLLLKFSS